jgi:hypothetical protein
VTKVVRPVFHFIREAVMQVTGKGRVRRREAEWRDLVSRWEASGQGVREFCRGQEIQISSFQRWRQRLAASATRSDFIPVTRVATAAAPCPTWSLDLVLPNGCTLRFQG